jgi:DNA primase
MTVWESDDVQDIAAVLKHYGFEDIPEKSGWQTVRCAFHDENKPSARVSLDAGAMKCLACGASGDAIKLIMWKEGVNYGNALDKYKTIVGYAAPGKNQVKLTRGFESSGAPKAYERRRGVLRWLKGE